MSSTKSVAIILVVICIVLAASLVFIVVNRPSAVSSSDQTSINNLKNQVTELNSQVTTLDKRVSDYQAYAASLESEIDEYRKIVALNAYNVIINNQEYTQTADKPISLFNDYTYFYVEYAGYMQVQVESTSSTTYIQVAYTFNDLLEFNQTFVVGTDGTAYFPVLPGNIAITLGNTNNEITTATVTLIHYY